MKATTKQMSHAAPWRVTVSMPTGQTDGRTDGRLPLDAASVMTGRRAVSAAVSFKTFKIRLKHHSSTSVFNR